MNGKLKVFRVLLAAVSFGMLPAGAQTYQGSHVNLYLPHFADGGSTAAKWQTSFVFVNPNSIPAALTVYFYGDDGQPLALDFGFGPSVVVSTTVPPKGSRRLRSTAASPVTISGWALALSNAPLQATVLFRSIQNGVPKAEISAAATLPTQSYSSIAGSLLGIAVVNPSFTAPLTFSIAGFNADGVSVGTKAYSLPARGHSAFNLNQVFTDLGNSFAGSITISGNTISDTLLAWTLNADASGILSSLPPGGLEWPISHADRIRLVYARVLNAAVTIFGNSINITNPAPRLVIDSTRVINAFATTSGEIHITLTVSQLISDSPSELGWLVAHELAHILQYRSGSLLLYPSNKESDADQVGMLLAISAGFDPYAGAGALAKLSMASGEAGLVDQFFDSISGEVHGSFNTRIANMFSLLKAVCTGTGKKACDAYRDVIHPDFPITSPLSVPGQL